MWDTVETLAHNLFKRQYPRRDLDVAVTQQAVGVAPASPPATEPEREYFRRLAQAEILRDAREKQ